MSNKRLKIQSFHYADIETAGDSRSKKLFLLLHGYGESGHKMLKRLRPYLPSDAYLLAPNGVYPLPARTEEGYQMGFAWYFFDPVSLKYFIDYDLPASFLKSLVEELGLQNKEITIIGYSQGGYLAPFAGEKLEQCKQVISVNANYKYEMYNYPIPFKFYGLNGMKDEIVDPHNAQKSFEKLLEKGVSGKFFGFPEDGHRFSRPFLEKIKELGQ